MPGQGGGASCGMIKNQLVPSGIKFARIDGANLRGGGWPRCDQRPEQHATLVHPYSAIGACERHYNIFDTMLAGDEGGFVTFIDCRWGLAAVDERNETPVVRRLSFPTRDHPARCLALSWFHAELQRCRRPARRTWHRRLPRNHPTLGGSVRTDDRSTSAGDAPQTAYDLAPR